MNALVEYKNKTFLKSILNVEDKLLAPLVFNKYILKQIEEIQYILSRFSNSNLVKLWLLNEFEHERIIINAKVGKNINNKFIFNFNENETGLDTRLLKDNKLNLLYTGCYIINFNKQYYIGSTTNFKNRFRSHTSNIGEYLKRKTINFLYENYKLNEIQRFYLLNEKNVLNFEIKILYLNTNYLNKFRFIYPDYKLSKGELILLKRINDFVVKFLEESLLRKFHPFLNMAENVIFKHFEWNDEFLDYNSRNNKVFKYYKTKKLHIFIITKSNEREDFYNFILNKYYSETCEYRSKVLIFKGSLQDICYAYNLKYYEVLVNLNKFHHYESSILKNPLKIVEIK
jgi:GIY-YIG catalytic domain